MKLPPHVSRLIARLAFLASLLFALGSPGTALAAMVSMGGDNGALVDDEDKQQGDNEVALHRHADDVRGAREASRRSDVGAAGPRVQSAVPFRPAHRVRRARPRPPYVPLLRMLC